MGTHPLPQVNTLIVGASAAGLSCASQLKRRGIEFKIIERQPHVGHAWRNHYSRLHLHTNKSSSHLPFVKFDKEIPKYPSKNQVVAYLEHYCRINDIDPEYNTTVNGIVREQKVWVVHTNKETATASNIILCTGNTNTPRRASKPGLDTFPGTVIHSSEYTDGSAFKGKKVLVVGFGNSACEIAICLHEHGAYPALSVRSPVNVIPRDILGIPVLQLGILQSKIPPRLADKLNRPLINLMIGNLEKLGLKKLPYGPIEQIVAKHQIPLLDIGTIDLIKQGQVKVYGDIVSINKQAIHFDKGIEDQFDAIIMATGYETGLDNLLELSADRKADVQRNIKRRKLFGEDHLYFCGFHVAPTGMLREIGLESEIIAESIDQLKRST